MATHTRLSARERMRRQKLQVQTQNRKQYQRLMALPQAERNAFTSRRLRGVYARRSGLVKRVKAAHVCAVCGGACEHTHHVDPDDKSFELGKAALHSYAEIIRESAKTVCVCAKDHRAIHTGKATLPLDAKRLIIPPEMLPAQAPLKTVRLARRIQQRGITSRG